MKQTLLEKVSILLLKKGCTLKTLTRTCFDIIARKSERILLVKILEDANSLNIEFAGEMLHLSSYLNAHPIIVAEKAGKTLDDNVIYERYGIYTLNFDTFRNCIEDKMPFIKSDHAGLTTKIIGDKLKGLRESNVISINTLANKIGVSAKMIQKYEAGTSSISINRAVRLYNIFGDSIFDKIDIFNVASIVHISYSDPISKKYYELGFSALHTKKAPFDVVAKKEEDIILTEIGDSASPHLQPLSKLIDANNLVIFNKKRPHNIPSLTKQEFLEFEEANELIKFVKEKP